eukprot:jgi/Chlat1/2426/Chrsp17S02675
MPTSKSTATTVQTQHAPKARATLASNTPTPPDTTNNISLLTVRSIDPTHGPSSGGTIITIHGSNLGTRETVERVAVGGVACVTYEVEVEESVLRCKVPPGTGAYRAIEFDVNGLVSSSSTRSALFSYDVPVVLRVEPSHAPRSGGTMLIIRGKNFGAAESFPLVSIGGAPCQATRWIGDEAIRCVAPGGTGTNLPVCGCGDAVDDAQSSNPVPLFAYDDDLVRDVAGSLLAGLAMKPGRTTTTTLSLVAHKAQVRESRYEVEFVEPVTKTRLRFAVPPELLGAIPAEDFAARYDTCAVVGNSGSLINSELGGNIDEADAVFRIHNAGTHRFESDVGSKTTFQVLNHFWTEMLMRGEENGPQDARWWVEEATLVLYSQHSQEAYVQLRQLFPTSSIIYLSRNLAAFADAAALKITSRIDEALHSTTGDSRNQLTEASSTFHAVCDSVDLYGADMRGKKYHYYDDYDPGDEERERASTEWLMYLTLASAKLVRLRGTNMEENNSEMHTLAPVQIQGTLPVCKRHECAVDCNKHGSWRNGTCVCDPIYAGSDCSIDRMASEAKALVAGLDVRYVGPLSLHRACVVNGSFVELPRGVDNMLYSALPEGDAQERYGTCAIVGNSGALLRAEYGREIDAHDMVWRFNQAPVKGYETHVGARTTHESLNGKSGPMATKYHYFDSAVPRPGSHSFDLARYVYQASCCLRLSQ